MFVIDLDMNIIYSVPVLIIWHTCSRWLLQTLGKIYGHYFLDKLYSLFCFSKKKKFKKKKTYTSPFFKLGADYYSNIYVGLFIFGFSSFSNHVI